MMVRTSRRPSFRSPAGRATAGGGDAISAAAAVTGSAVLRFGAVVIDKRRAPKGFGPSFAPTPAQAQGTVIGGSYAGAVCGLLCGSVGQTNGPVQRPLLDREQATEGNRGTDGGGDEDPVKSRRHIAVRCCEFLQRHDARTIGAPAEHDGAEDRDNDRAAERTKEIQRTGCGAELVRFDHVLHEYGADRIHRSETAADRKQEAAGLEPPMVRRNRRED